MKRPCGSASEKRIVSPIHLRNIGFGLKKPSGLPEGLRPSATGLGQDVELHAQVQFGTNPNPHTHHTRSLGPHQCSTAWPCATTSFFFTHGFGSRLGAFPFSLASAQRVARVAANLCARLGHKACSCAAHADHGFETLSVSNLMGSPNIQISTRSRISVARTKTVLLTYNCYAHNCGGQN